MDRYYKRKEPELSNVMNDMNQCSYDINWEEKIITPHVTS
jgi:hypothetical protein